jgi:hypothetical protein
VCDQETSKNEETKARYRAVENTTKRVVTPGKQTNKDINVAIIEFNRTGGCGLESCGSDIITSGIFLYSAIEFQKLQGIS